MSDFYDFHAKKYQAGAFSRAVIVVAIVVGVIAYNFISLKSERNELRGACIHDGIPPKECERIFP